MTLVYRDCLFGKEVFYAKNVGIRSKDHILSLVESEKKALCPIDTKRWILSDGITTLPYFHWRIMFYKNMVKADIPHEQAEKRATFLYCLNCLNCDESRRALLILI
ncbi:hypothetical protein RclHR1_01660006 [Rhizophagus clarus]|uniref:Uncharacterized protein n=1 Tax=Rhizophagus clarus TaxID=94130 RepID=A0A2Z6QHZ0_9GLOM|nr:hypothetical protein RclHR1_01660006 [Rhizophagus clarus]